MNELFEKAARCKYRWDYKGVIDSEDLWDLSVTSLDTIFKRLNVASKAQKEESLLAVRSASDEVLDAKIDIVKHIVMVKLAEREASRNAKAKAAQKQKILGIIEIKQDAALHDMPVEELSKLADTLG